MKTIRTVRVALLVGAGALIVAALTYGPTLWEAWHFLADVKERRLEAANAEVRAVAMGVTCNHCHGENGNSRSDFYPALAGQPAPYLTAQMSDFAAGRRSSPHMEPLALYLSDADRRLISEHYARQQAVSEEPPPGRPLEASLSSRLNQCKSCHGPDLQGVATPVAAPRLAGQAPGYVLRQLEAFKSGARRDATGTMASFAQTLDNAELASIAKAATGWR